MYCTALYSTKGSEVRQRLLLGAGRRVDQAAHAVFRKASEVCLSFRPAALDAQRVLPWGKQSKA